MSKVIALSKQLCVSLEMTIVLDYVKFDRHFGLERKTQIGNML